MASESTVAPRKPGPEVGLVAAGRLKIWKREQQSVAIRTQSGIWTARQRTNQHDGTLQRAEAVWSGRASGGVARMGRAPSDMTASCCAGLTTPRTGPLAHGLGWHLRDGHLAL